jgi:hypothetical protein
MLPLSTVAEEAKVPVGNAGSVVHESPIATVPVKAMHANATANRPAIILLSLGAGCQGGID